MYSLPPIRILLGLAAVCLAGCHDEESPQPGYVERLEMGVWRADPKRADVNVIERFEIPAGLDPWRVKGSKGRISQSSELGVARPVLDLIGPKRALIQIPGKFESGTFDNLIVTMYAAARPSVSARFLKDREPLATSDKIIPARQQIEVVTVPITIPEGQTANMLELTISPLKQPVRIFDLALTKVGREAFMPMPETGADLVELSGDARRALGVSSRASLTRKFTVPEGGVLAFDYGWPRAVQDPDIETVVVVRVQGPEGSVHQSRYPLTPAEYPNWQHVEIPLGAHAGKQVSLQLGVRSSEGVERESAAAITEPALYIPDPQAPVVVLVTSDTHRFDHVGKADAGVDVATPFLDALADRGVFFDNCLTSANVTLPSHVSLLTGKTPRDTGVYQNNIPLTDAAPTLAERFADAGYHTIAVVAVEHLGDPESNLGQGFDRMSWPRGNFDAGSVVDRVLLWSEDYADRPLFVWAHVFDAHTPYSPPSAEYVERYYSGDPRDHNLPAPDFPKPPGYEGIRDADYVTAQYRGEVSYLDAQLGRLFEHPRFSKGILAFTADHGESLGAHDIWWTHSGLYPDTIHVPLILTWPGAPAGRRETSSVRQIELGRTLLDLAGLGQVEFPGRSLVELADSVDTPRFAISARHLEASATVGPWHCILTLGSGGRMARHGIELFNLTEDPQCSRDLVAEQPDRARAMRQLLVEWLVTQPENNWAGEADTSEDRLQALAELGYVIDVESSGDTVLFDASCGCQVCAQIESLD